MNANGDEPSLGMRAAAALFYGLSSFAIMGVNKIVLTQYGFPSVNVIALCQMVLTVACLWLAKQANLVSFPSFSSNVFSQVFPLPLLYLLNLLSGLGGTKLISLPMFTLLRRFSILLTMLAEKYLLGVQPEVVVQVSVAMMLGGALVAAADDLAFNFNGYFFILLNDIFTAAQGVYLKKRLSDSRELGKFGLMFYNCLFSIPALVALLAIDPDQVTAVQQFEAWSDPWFIVGFVASCVMGFVLTYSIFLCTQVNSALTTTVVGCLKNILVSYLGMMLNDYIFTMINFAGINISIAGSLLYSYRQYQVTQERMKKADKQQNDSKRAIQRYTARESFRR